MVWTDPVSQDPDALRRLSEHHGMPIVSLHAPTLLITQRVWGTDPWPKLRPSLRAGAWPWAPARSSCTRRSAGSGTTPRASSIGVAELREHEFGVALAVENMFPWRARGRELLAYLPHWDPVGQPYEQRDARPLAHRDRRVRRAGDGGRPRATGWCTCTWPTASGSAKDEHLVPGRGTQPCAELLERLAARRSTGNVVVEVGTRRADDRTEREADLAEALAFARLHLAAAPA